MKNDVQHLKRAQHGSRHRVTIVICPQVQVRSKPQERVGVLIVVEIEPHKWKRSSFREDQLERVRQDLYLPTGLACADLKIEPCLIGTSSEMRERRISTKIPRSGDADAVGGARYIRCRVGHHELRTNLARAVVDKPLIRGTHQVVANLRKEGITRAVRDEHRVARLCQASLQAM